MAAADLPGDWLERLKIPLVLGVVVLLYGGTQFEETRPFVARTLAYGVPGLALIYGLLPLRHSHGLLRVLAVVTAAAIFLLGALRTREVLRAPAIVARAELQEGQPSLLNPKRGSSFNAEIAARFAKEGDLPGKLRIELRREGRPPAKLDLSFDNIRETSWMKTRQLVRVPGSGPIRVAIVREEPPLGA